ncbi:hypothetical protein GCM10010832_05040 [Psychroflexus planctonicus]|uniref:Uncharacterized protein n=1 Tax=Psychroflexus planctonicus TaxID=1526575 RepID=A0ABQ1SFQ5_9FLAO|nr:hypothetical protein GCM10010832_05040 [Psychroflexus planctonicus]
MIISVYSCKKENKEFDLGYINNNVYVNNFFKFKIDLPKEWIPKTDDFYRKNNEVVKEVLAGDDRVKNRILDKDEINTVNLIGLFKNKENLSIDLNPNILITAKNLEYYPDITNINDDLNQTVSFLQDSKIEDSGIKIIYLSKEFEKIIIGNQVFYKLDATFNYNGLIVNQEVYSTIRNNFSLAIILSFKNKNDKQLMHNILTSINFYE